MQMQFTEQCKIARNSVDSLTEILRRRVDGGAVTSGQDLDQESGLWSNQRREDGDMSSNI